MEHHREHDLGLAHDLATLQRQRLARRGALRWLTGAGALALIGCGGGGTDSTPAIALDRHHHRLHDDRHRLVNIVVFELFDLDVVDPIDRLGDPGRDRRPVSRRRLEQHGRRHRERAGAERHRAQRHPLEHRRRDRHGRRRALTVVIELVNTNGACADLSGYAIYLWHCDREGRYSMYSSGVTAENYLRGVQETASDGTATFTTIVPGCYSGRMPHIHFEVYRNANTASAWTNKLRTSQLALPTDVCSAVYAGATGY
jgi:hypothetical protein